jgi:hypothetical protein
MFLSFFRIRKLASDMLKKTWFARLLTKDSVEWEAMNRQQSQRSFG